MSAKVWIKTGAEGPAYDPYGYTEIVVNIRGVEYVYHAGLGERIKVDGVNKTDADEGDSSLVNFFKQLTGFYPHQWEKFYYKLQHRRRSKCFACGSKKIEGVRGYPGETLFQCQDCHQIVDTEFHESTVI